MSGKGKKARNKRLCLRIFVDYGKCFNCGAEKSRTWLHFLGAAQKPRVFCAVCCPIHGRRR